MNNIDLHIHTTASDGTDTPTEAVEKAARLGLSAIAITDHDSVSGVKEALAAGERFGVEVVPGIEVSSDYRSTNVHILGYFIDLDNGGMQPVLDWVINERLVRNTRMVDMLRADGFDISMEELAAAYPASVLGRPHIAEMLAKKGYCESVKDGFSKYLNRGRKYYLPKQRISMEKAVQTIREAGGVAVLAHPLEYFFPDNEVVEMMEYGKSLGIRAAEAYYSEHSLPETEKVLAMAKQVGLGVTGGSDYHGPRKAHIEMGKGTGLLNIPYSILEDLKALRGK